MPNFITQRAAEGCGEVAILGRRTSRHSTTPNFPEKLVNILSFFENGKIPIKII